MAIQYLTIIKAVAPYVAEVAKVAIPAFTSKRGAASAEAVRTDPTVTRQIEELQAAASQNAQSVKRLAEMLQQALEEIEASAQEAARKAATYRFILICAVALSSASLGLSLYLLLR